MRFKRFVNHDISKKKSESFDISEGRNTCNVENVTYTSIRRLINIGYPDVKFRAGEVKEL